MIRHSLSVAALAAALAAPAWAAEPPISLSDSFRIGTGAGVVCTAQRSGTDKVLKDMFDQGYAVTCRDASAPVGRLYALRVRGEDPAARLGASLQGLGLGRVHLAGPDRPRARALRARAVHCSLRWRPGRLRSPRRPTEAVTRRRGEPATRRGRSAAGACGWSARSGRRPGGHRPCPGPGRDRAHATEGTRAPVG